jgi:outer membrane cobalamin receptor
MRTIYVWIFFLLIAAGACAQTRPDSLHAARPSEPHPDSLQAAATGAPLRPKRPATAPFFADSTLRLGSGYGSEADLFALLPGACFFDRGSIGLPALGSFFAGTTANLNLIYDGLRLDDPLNGRSDLNLIPVESIASQALFTDPLTRPSPGLAASQTLEITGRDLAAAPMRSQVAYRTGGNGYDDIDVRAGLHYSSRLNINAGGVLKNYAGTTSQLEKYRAQKINLAITRTFGSLWRVDYRLLYNTFDLNLPVHEALLPAPTLQQPHQKESRYDHGLEVNFADSWRTLIQLTDHHRERYGYRHGVWDESTDVLRLNLLSEGFWKWQRIEGTVGGEFRSTGLKSASWGDHGQNIFAGWGSMVARPRAGMLAAGQLRIEKAGDDSAALLPQLQLRQDLQRGWQAIAWYEQSRASASLAARFESSPFALGNSGLSAASGDHLGLGVRHAAPSLQLFLAASASRIQNEALLTWDAQQALPRYENQSEQQRFSLDASMEWRFSSWFTLTGKARQMFFNDLAPLNQPETAANGWLQINHIFFRGDLDVRLRLGCSFWGERRGPIPWYVEASPEIETLGAVAVPWLHATIKIKDATLFFALQNPLGIDYEVVRAYAMPGQQIRWGFVWNFYD